MHQHTLTTGFGCTSQTNPVFFRVSLRARAGFFAGCTKGKDARCSDAVLTSCLAAHPDAFLIRSAPRGFPAHMLRFKEPSPPHRFRRSVVTRSEPLESRPSGMAPRNLHDQTFFATLPQNIPAPKIRPVPLKHRGLCVLLRFARTFAVRKGSQIPLIPAREKRRAREISCG